MDQDDQPASGAGGAPATAGAPAKAPKKRAARAAPDQPSRTQNVTALRNLKQGENYKKDNLLSIAQSIAAITAIDFYNKTPSSYTPDNLWGIMTVLAAANSLNESSFGLHNFSLKQAAERVADLKGRFKLLIDRVVAADPDVALFRDTFLNEVAALVDIGRDESVDAKAPVRCEMVRALLPSEATTRLEITYVGDVASKQTISVAAKMVPLIQKLVFVARLPMACYETALKVLHKKATSREYVAGKTKIKEAVSMVLAETGDTSIVKTTQSALMKTITDLSTSPNKFNEVRKLIVKDVDGIAVDTPAADVADGQAEIEFATDAQ
jgi:hypothetical protein